MLGLLLIYFIGKQYYDLALKYNKSKWGFAILGVAAYYVPVILTQVFLIFGDAYGYFSLNMDELIYGLMGIPIGILACVALYQILKNAWSRNRELQTGEELLDDTYLK